MRDQVCLYQLLNINKNLTRNFRIKFFLAKISCIITIRLNINAYLTWLIQNIS